MKKLLSLLFSFICVVSLYAFVGCAEKGEENKFKLIVINGEYLIEELDESYCVGEEVNVKIKVPLDGDYKVLLDDISLIKTEIKQGDTVAYYEYTFTMPNREATLKIDHYICGDPIEQ